MKKNNRIRIILSTILILLLSTTIVNAVSGNASVTSSIEVGKEGSIKLGADAPGGFFQGTEGPLSGVSVSDSSVIKVASTGISADTGDSKTANPSQSISFTALKAGTTNVKVSFRGESLAGEGFSYDKTFTVTVAAKPTPAPTKPAPTKPAPTKPAPTKPAPTVPVIDNTEKDKQEPKTPEKTAEEIERENLAERMKTPLIREIGIISASERLKGEKLGTIEPESQKFEYSAVLPRNVNEIKLEIKRNKEDVELTFDEVISIEEGEDSVVVVIKAVQGKLEQEFSIVFEKPEESKFIMERDSKELKLIVDPFLDEAMADLGFERMLINKEDPSLGFYFTYNNQDFIIVADEENNGFVYLLDDQKNPTREVFLVTNSKNEVSILVNETLAKDDQRQLKENDYEEHEVEISKILTDMDPTMKFNNSLAGWIFDEDSIITHGFTSEGSELVHLDKLGEVKEAFVSFDIVPEVDNSIDKLTYLGFGLWIVTLIAFGIYAIVKAKKAKEEEMYY